MKQKNKFTFGLLIRCVSAILLSGAIGYAMIRIYLNKLGLDDEFIKVIGDGHLAIAVTVASFGVLATAYYCFMIHPKAVKIAMDKYLSQSTSNGPIDLLKLFFFLFAPYLILLLSAALNLSAGWFFWFLFIENGISIFILYRIECAMSESELSEDDGLTQSQPDRLSGTWFGKQMSKLFPGVKDLPRFVDSMILLVGSTTVSYIPVLAFLLVSDRIVSDSIMGWIVGATGLVLYAILSAACMLRPWHGQLGKFKFDIPLNAIGLFLSIFLFVAAMPNSLSMVMKLAGLRESPDMQHWYKIDSKLVNQTVFLDEWPTSEKYQRENIDPTSGETGQSWYVRGYSVFSTAENLTICSKSYFEDTNKQTGGKYIEMDAGDNCLSLGRSSLQKVYGVSQKWPI